MSALNEYAKTPITDEGSVEQREIVISAQLGIEIVRWFDASFEMHSCLRHRRGAFIKSYVGDAFFETLLFSYNFV